MSKKTHSVAKRAYPYDRTVEITRVHAHTSDDYDGVTLSITDEDEKTGMIGNYCHAYFTNKEQLDQMIVDLVTARIEWENE